MLFLMALNCEAFLVRLQMQRHLARPADCQREQRRPLLQTHLRVL
jgi:hypothetical protein